MINVAISRKLRDVEFVLKEVKYQFKTGTKCEFKEAIRMLRENVLNLEESVEEEK